jgi:hypothetical protein
MWIPLGGGWASLLYPGSTSAVPEEALHTSLVRQLLAAKLIELTDGAAWDADIRQRRAARTDMTRAIAAAEKAEFDRLLAGMRRPRPPRPQRQPRPRKPRADEWSTAQVDLLKRRHAAGASWDAIAVELGRTPAAVAGMARREGLQRPRQRPAGNWPSEWTETLKRRWSEGVPGRKIAEELGVKPTVVWTRCARLGLEKRFDNRNGGRSASRIGNTLGAL